MMASSQIRSRSVKSDPLTTHALATDPSDRTWIANAPPPDHRPVLDSRSATAASTRREFSRSSSPRSVRGSLATSGTATSKASQLRAVSPPPPAGRLDAQPARAHPRKAPSVVHRANSLMVAALKRGGVRRWASAPTRVCRAKPGGNSRRVILFGGHRTAQVTQKARPTLKSGAELPYHRRAAIDRYWNAPAHLTL